MTEWRIIPSYPNYEASSDGEIRHRPPYRASSTGKPLSLYRHKNGYLRAHVSVGDRIVYPWAHRLVCEAFHGPAPDPKAHAAHRNGIQHDNRPENLSWLSASENRADRVRHGTELNGERHPGAKLTSAAVIEIRSLRGLTALEIAARFGVSAALIYRIQKRKIWRHI